MQEFSNKKDPPPREGVRDQVHLTEDVTPQPDMPLLQGRGYLRAALPEAPRGLGVDREELSGVQQEPGLEPVRPPRVLPVPPQPPPPRAQGLPPRAGAAGTSQ